MSITRPDVETATFETLQETYQDFFVPQFTVTVAGKEFEPEGLISDVSVDLALDKATAFSFTLNHRYSHENGEFEEMDWERFAPDQSVDVRMGYGPTRKPLLTDGRITAVRPEFPSSGSPTIAVTGYGLLHTMTEPPETNGDSLTHTWEETAPDGVVEKVVEDRGYPFEEVRTVPVGVEPPEIKQDDSDHDLQFLLDLAEQYAYELFAWDGDLYFQPPRYDGPPDVVLTYGSSLDSFSPEINEAGQLDKVVVRNWSAEKGEEIVGEATRDELVANGDSSGEPTSETLRLPVRTTTQAKARAKAVLANRLDGAVSGKGECLGLPEIRPGTRIGLDGLTDRFSTTYYVESATHRFASSGYRTTFSVKRRAV